MKKLVKGLSVISIVALLCACKQEPYIKMRGIVVNTHDLSTVDWPKLAHDNGINTIGTHMFPHEVEAFIVTDKGKKFMADCAKYGIAVEHQLHSMGELLPRKLFADDSTMFRMNDQGRRTNDCNLCVHSDKALDIVANNAVRLAKVLPTTNHRYYFWIDDGQPMCRCPECSKYSDSEQALIVENRMIKALREYDSEATLAHLAYGPTLSAPRQVKPDPNIFLEYAPIQRSFDKPLAEQGEKIAALLQQLKDNLQVFPAETAVVLEYWLDVSMFSKWTKPAVKLPWNKAVFEADLKTYTSLGLRNFTTFGVYIDDKYIETYKDLSFLKEYGEGLERFRP